MRFEPSALATHLARLAKVPPSVNKRSPNSESPVFDFEWIYRSAAALKAEAASAIKLAKLETER